MQQYERHATIMTVTDTYLLLRAFCDELARCGVKDACTSPGSRCTPIVLSLVRDGRIRCWSHLDERCAGFFALGAAKASGRPATVTCTSGTAAANLSPAVIEAREARVPLIVLTADRPPELREVGAGQTIDQVKLYGDAAKWFFEVGVHDASEDRLRWIRALACRAYWSAITPPAGPVHLNFPLREPLVLGDPLPDDWTGRADARPYVVFEPPTPVSPSGQSHAVGKTVIVAGSGAQAPERLAAFAAQTRMPLLADPLSGARRGAAAIAHYDLLLRNPEFAAEERPQFVIRVGDLPTSKPLRTWLASLHDVAQMAIDPNETWHDPDSVVGMRLSTLPIPSEANPAPSEWLARWRAADDAAAAAIERVLGDTLSEPLVARRLCEWLAPEAILFVASSMPIRDVEAFAPAGAQAPMMLSNRGANGIDGTVSAAFGAAAATARPTVLLAGDVALAHDIGGLLAARRLQLSLTIVLLNNDGGGIFHFLPIAGERDAFEEHVATPHGLDFERAAALYGCGYRPAETVDELHAAVQAAERSPSTSIIEVRTDREQNVALHRELEAAVRTELELAASAQ
jgi:2-succinyl-5-enolpyruvyl-6-hydroxy-3-cyclohexene-1-carboxylate synthase